MKRYNSFISLKESFNKHSNKINPSVESEFKKFINMLKDSAIKDKQLIEDSE